MAYRFLPLCASAISLVLSILAVYFLISALVTFRTPDFVLASSNDFSKLGTCLERVTNDQLLRSNFDSPSAETCAKDYANLGDANDNPNQNLLPNRYANALAASVHGLWYTSQQTVDGVSVFDADLMRVAKIVVTATIGEKLSSATWTKTVISNNLQKVSTNETFSALNKIVNLPKTCQLLYPTASIPSPSESLTPFVNKPPVRCEFGGDAYDVPTNLCGGSVTSECPDSVEPIDDITTSAIQDLLLKHCELQFSYARSGNAPGSFHLPVVHSDSRAPGPLFAPYAEIAGWNSTSNSLAGEWPYSARVAQGIRFGWCTWAYVPTMLGLGYLAIDSLILFIAELARPDLLIAQAESNDGSAVSVLRDLMIMSVTFDLKRSTAFTFSIVTFVVAAVFWGIFVGGPWDFGTAMPRPICDEGEVDYWWEAYPFSGDSFGGWRLDWDATFLELVVLTIMLFSILLEVVARSVNFGSSGRRGGGLPNSTNKMGDGNTTGQTCSQNTGIWIAFIFFAGVVLLAGQAAVGARFGYAWAEGIASQYPSKGYTANEFNPSTLATTIYHQTMASFAVSAVVGMTLAAAIGRWLVPGDTCESFLVFLVWLLVAIGSFIPLIIVYGINTWFDEDEQIKDCKIFKDANGGEGIPYVEELCFYRWITFLTGVGLLTIAVVGITLVGCFTLSPAVLKNKTKKTAEIPSWWDSLARFNRTTEGVPRVSGTAVNASGLKPLKFTTDTPFYNWGRNVSPEDKEQRQRLIKDPSLVGPGMTMRM